MVDIIVVLDGRVTLCFSFLVLAACYFLSWGSSFRGVDLKCYPLSSI